MTEMKKWMAMDKNNNILADAIARTAQEAKAQMLKQLSKPGREMALAAWKEAGMHIINN
jgi:hypothetical protein